MTFELHSILADCKRCACNKHSSSCDPRTCKCRNCRDNTEGDNCEKCKPGFTGDARNGGKCTPAVKMCPCGKGAKTEKAPCNQNCECKVGKTARIFAEKIFSLLAPILRVCTFAC